LPGERKIRKSRKPEGSGTVQGGPGGWKYKRAWEVAAEGPKIVLGERVDYEEIREDKGRGAPEGGRFNLSSRLGGKITQRDKW